MKRIFLALTLTTIVFTGCSKAPVTQPAMKPESVVETFLHASSTGDIDTCLSLLADDIVIKQDPPGVEIKGKAQLEAALRSNAAWHQQYTVIGPIKTEGDKVTLSVKSSSDNLKICGLESMSTNMEFQVSDGKIESWLAMPDAGDWQKLAELTAGGIGVKFEFTAQGIKVTEMAKNSPAYEAGLKPGDLIIAVNGIGYSQMMEGEIQLRIRGPVGSKVKLTTTHEGAPAPTEMEVTRIDMAQLSY